MADVAVTTVNVISLSKNTRTATPTGQSVATGSTAVLTPQAGAPFKGRYMLIRAVPGAASTLTVKAGVTGGTPSNQAALGDLAVASFTADSVIQVELSRFLQSDGTVRVDVGGTGPVVFTVVQLSKNAA
jgi:hypothetical protein